MNKNKKIVLIVFITVVIIALIFSYMFMCNNLNIDANTKVNNLINSSEYQEMTYSERKIVCEKLLKELKSKGAIKYYSYIDFFY